MEIKRIDNVLDGTGVTHQPSTGESIIRGLRDAVDGKWQKFYIRRKPVTVDEWRALSPGNGENVFDGPQAPSLDPSE